MGGSIRRSLSRASSSTSKFLKKNISEPSKKYIKKIAFCYNFEDDDETAEAQEKKRQELIRK